VFGGDPTRSETNRVWTSRHAVAAQIALAWMTRKVWQFGSHPFAKNAKRVGHPHCFFYIT